MALTEQQIQQIRVKYGITPPDQNMGGDMSETPEQRIKRLRSEVPTGKESILKGIAKDLNFIARPAVNAYNVVSSVGTLGAAGIAKVAGKDKLASDLVKQAGIESEKVRNVPFFGEVKPVGTSDSLATNVKDILGNGAQIGSLIAMGGGASTAKLGLRTAMKVAGKEGLKVGAASGGLYEGGKALQEDAPMLDVLQRTLVGSAVGGAFGTGMGFVSPIVSRSYGAVKDATGAVIKGVRNQLPNVEKPQTFLADPIGAIADTFTIAKSKVQKMFGGSRENLATNADILRKGKEVFENLPEKTKSVIKKGLSIDDVQFYEKMPEADKNIARKLVEGAENFEQGERDRLPSLIADEYNKRLKGLGTAIETEGKNLDEIVSTIKGAKLDANTTVDAVLTSMGEKEGLKGLTITPDGLLDFSKTTLSGTNSKAARQEIQRIFDDVVQRANDPERLHLYRKELFEDLGGKKSGGIKLTGTEEDVVNAMRQGMANAIETVSPRSYKEANQKLATLLDIQKETNKLFGNPNDYDSEIFNETVTKLMRRLTSNSKSGGEIAQIIREMETSLQGYGMSFDTNIKNIQEFVNILNKYYDIAPGTSLMGIIKSSQMPQGKVGMVEDFINLIHEGSRATPETAKFAIKELLGEISGQAKKNFRNVPNQSIPNLPDSEVEKRAFDLIKKDEVGLLKKYKEKNGKIINTDNFRPLFAEQGYKGYNSAAVQEPSSYLAKKAYSEALKNPGQYATILAGGSGAGKSSAVKNSSKIKAIMDESSVVLDGNLSSYPSAIKKIQEAQNAGKITPIVYVYRDPLDAFENGVIKRMLTNPEEMGRLVPSKEVAKNHKGSWETVKQLYDEGFEVFFFDNSLGEKKSKISSFQELSKKINFDDNLLEKMNQIAKKLYEQGTITAEQYKGYTN